MTCIKTVSFDADQTLFDFQRTLEDALNAVSAFLYDDFGLQISAQVLRSTRDEIYEQSRGHAMEMLTIRRLSFQRVLVGHPDCDMIVEQAMQLFEDVRFGTVYWYPDTREVLRQLKEQFQLVLITNGNSDPERAGLEGVFDHILLGEKFSFKKPDPRIFHEMFKRAKVQNPATVCHVGDSLAHDVKGANGVGAVSVWFNAEGQSNKTDIVPNHTISSMSELTELL
ncbi:HAD family hydrolase [uncultured Maritalea sp.]|uniref:HAD family hydrolase n=1 Tax=uncultured Maritalea sp. TaxID=757249 RepID=UPI002604EC66|nr:HAD family hydrolase [uncultured Maritalea sp.]